MGKHKTEHEIPTDDDRRSEGLTWCRLHGWFFAKCDKCEKGISVTELIKPE